MIDFVGDNDLLMYGSGAATIAGWGSYVKYGSSWGPWAGVTGIVSGGIGLNAGGLAAARYCSALTQTVRTLVLAIRRQFTRLLH